MLVKIKTSVGESDFDFIRFREILNKNSYALCGGKTEKMVYEKNQP